MSMDLMTRQARAPRAIPVLWYALRRLLERSQTAGVGISEILADDELESAGQRIEGHCKSWTIVPNEEWSADPDRVRVTFQLSQGHQVVQLALKWDDIDRGSFADGKFRVNAGGRFIEIGFDPEVYRPVTRYEERFLHKEGEVKVVAENGNPVFSSKGCTRVYFRPHDSQEWRELSRQPHPDWKSMPLAEYVLCGRPEFLRYVSHGHLMRVSSKLGLPLVAVDPHEYQEVKVTHLNEAIPSEGILLDPFVFSGHVELMLSRWRDAQDDVRQGLQQGLQCVEMARRALADQPSVARVGPLRMDHERDTCWHYCVEGLGVPSGVYATVEVSFNYVDPDIPMFEGEPVGREMYSPRVCAAVHSADMAQITHVHEFKRPLICAEDMPLQAAGIAEALEKANRWVLKALKEQAALAECLRGAPENVDVESDGSNVPR